LEHKEKLASVLAELQDLPEIDRAALLMRSLDGMSYERDRCCAECHGDSCQGESAPRSGQVDCGSEPEPQRVGCIGGNAMSVTRDVVTDLLPVYFSGEASEDTKRLMEAYFLEDPDFERIARKAATPLEQLRGAAPILPDAEREKHDLEWTREEFFRHRLSFGTALLFTLAPFMAIYSQGHLSWSALLHNPWEVTFFCWYLGALSWFQYFTRLGRRAYAVVWSIGFALLPLVCTFHLFLPGWQTGLSGRLAVAPGFWLIAVAIWANYLRQSSRLRRPGGQ
jgi:hypothetical protein